MLLGDVVARQPGVIEPVPELVFHVGHSRLPLDRPKAPLIPVASGGDDLADVAAVDALHRLDVAELVAALGSGDDGQILALGFLGGGKDLADAGAIHGDRLFAEQVLAGGDGRLDVVGAEPGRGGEDHEVDARVDHFLEGIEADEAAVVGDVDLVAEFRQLVLGVIEVVAEQVAHRVELDVRRRVDRLLGGAGPSTAAADEAHFDDVAPGGVGGARDRPQAQGPGSGGRGG